MLARTCSKNNDFLRRPTGGTEPENFKPCGSGGGPIIFYKQKVGEQKSESKVENPVTERAKRGGGYIYTYYLYMYTYIHICKQMSLCTHDRMPKHIMCTYV